MLKLLHMIPGVDLVDFIQAVSVFGVMLVIFAETGLMIGFFLPGDSLLFTAGFLTAAGVLNINIHLFALLLFISAILGNSTGYFIGYKAGPRIFKKPDAKLFKHEYVARAQDFYEKHGGKTITLAQFMPILRTFAPVVAGVGKMKFSRFLAFNALGAAFWAGGVTYAGYYLGNWFHSIGIEIDQVLLPIIALIILLSVTPPILHILKVKKNRQALMNRARSLFSFVDKK